MVVLAMWISLRVRPWLGVRGPIITLRVRYTFDRVIW